MATRVSTSLPPDLLADSRRPTIVFETGPPTRYYGEPVERPSTQWSHGIRSAPRGGGSGARHGPHETSDV